MAEALAGSSQGSQFTPRLGTEVLVDFIEGDIGRLVVVVQFRTGADTPPSSAGVEIGEFFDATSTGEARIGSIHIQASRLPIDEPASAKMN